MVTAVVGVLTAVGGYYQGAQGDLLTSGALLAFSVLYLAVAYALFAGVQDMRTIGNSALTVALVCGISAFLLLNGGAVKADGVKTIAVNYYFRFTFITFTILLLVIFAFAYGKASLKLVGALLVFLGVADLIVPAYSLIGYNTLPF